MTCVVIFRKQHALYYQNGEEKLAPSQVVKSCTLKWHLILQVMHILRMVNNEFVLNYNFHLDADTMMRCTLFSKNKDVGADLFLPKMTEMCKMFQQQAER